MSWNVFRNLTNWFFRVGLWSYGEKKLFKKRQAANWLYFIGGLSIRRIARELAMSRVFVRKWVQSPDQNLTRDDRGWQKGRRRRWDKLIEQRVKRLHERLVTDPERFFAGATVIAQEWRREYSGDIVPPLRTLGRVLQELGLTRKLKRGRGKGAARYLCYPEHTIYQGLGGRVLEVDFIGPKHLRGRSEPLNFIGFSFKQVPRLRYYQRVCGARADEFISACDQFFKEFERPDYVKVDNTGATIGSVSGKRNISRAMRFLLERGVVPIFSVPRKPFSQASIEGNNSVFSRTFWNRIKFTDVEEVDKKLGWFNTDSLRYLEYQRPSAVRRRKISFVPRVYFIRQVREVAEKRSNGSIDVLNESILLPAAYINYFVLAEWNLRTETLAVYFEKDLQSQLIKKISFAINLRSKNKSSKVLEKGGLLSYGT